MLKIKVKRTDNTIPLPEYMTEHASGMDVYASNEKDIIISSGERVLVPTGLYLEIPTGYEVQIRPRSGLAIKHGITLVNSPGTIDADYRGEIKIIMINHGIDPFVVKKGARIAQMVISPVTKAQWQEVSSASSHAIENLSYTKRGVGGFGHTG